MNESDLLLKLMSFGGIKGCHEIAKDLVISRGIKYLADQANCYWLITEIHKALPKRKKHFKDLLCEFSFSNRTGKLAISDYENLFRFEKDFPDIDFPLSEMPIHCQNFSNDWVLMTLHESLTALKE